MAPGGDAVVERQDGGRGTRARAAFRTEVLWGVGVTAALLTIAFLLPEVRAFHRRSPHRAGEEPVVLRARVVEVRPGEHVCLTNDGRRLLCELSRPAPESARPGVGPGTRVLVAPRTGPRETGRGAITTPLRERGLLVLAWLFLIALGWAGGRQGMRAAAGLAASGVLLLGVFLPLALKGVPPALLAVPVCVVLALLNLVLIAGPTRKMLFALGGTVAGSILAATFAQAASHLLGLTGLDIEFGANFHLGTRYWSALSVGRVDFGGLLVAGAMIASLGAAMDVAMVVASASSEAAERFPEARRYEAVRLGLRVGWDVVGIMVITLAFVFFGASLFSILSVGPNWGLALLSYEGMAAEVARLAAAGIGMTAAVPVTAWLGARYGGGKRGCSVGA